MNARDKLKKLRDEIVEATGFNSIRAVKDLLKEKFQFVGCRRTISKSSLISIQGKGNSIEAIVERETKQAVQKIAEDMHRLGFFTITTQEVDGNLEILVELPVLK